MKLNVDIRNDKTELTATEENLQVFTFNIHVSKLDKGCS